MSKSTRRLPAFFCLGNRFVLGLFFLLLLFTVFFFFFFFATEVTWLLLYTDCSSGDGNSSVNNLLFEMWSSDIKRFSSAAVAPFWIQMCAFHEGGAFSLCFQIV